MTIRSARCRARPTINMVRVVFPIGTLRRVRLWVSKASLCKRFKKGTSGVVPDITSVIFRPRMLVPLRSWPKKAKHYSRSHDSKRGSSRIGCARDGRERYPPPRNLVFPHNVHGVPMLIGGRAFHAGWGGPGERGKLHLGR